MFLTEYDEERARREIYDDGYDDGIEAGQLTVLWKFVKKNVFTLEEAASRINMTVEEFQSELTAYAIK